MKNKPIAVGVDIGGSHLTCAAVDMTAHRLLPQTENRVSIDHHAGVDELLDNWSAAINATIRKIEADKLIGIGFAMPGPFNYREGISQMQHKFASLYGIKIEDRLMPKLSVPDHLPMRFLNDATSFAVGEAWIGMGKGFKRVIAITLGTGFGSAFIDEGVPITKRSDVPQEGCLWHLPYESGIADEYFSTRWFLKEYEQLSGHKLENVKEIVLAAKQDPDVIEVFNRFGHNLSHLLLPWFRKFKADRLVIGGNISKAYSLFGPTFEENLYKEGVSVSVALSALGEKAALIGSTRLFEDSFWEKIQDQLPSI